MNKETIEGNKLIRVFMTDDPLQKELKEVKHIRHFEGLQYHSDWAQLMPVVEKIGKMYDPYKYKAFEDKEDAWEIVDLTIMNPINEVWDSVVIFIEWYNSQSKTK